MRRFILFTIWDFFFDRNERMFDKLDEDQKLAFCRIVREIAASDGIISKMELDSTRIEIPVAYFHKSRELSLDQAIEVMKTVEQGWTRRLVRVLENLAESDGIYSKEEMEIVHRVRVALHSA